MRKTTKLAGTKDMAKITQMETRTSTEVVILDKKRKKAKCLYVGTGFLEMRLGSSCRAVQKLVLLLLPLFCRVKDYHTRTC